MKKVNSGGVCSFCNTKSIHYGIENGSYTYFCVKCQKQLYKNDVLVVPDEPTQNELLDFVGREVYAGQGTLVGEMLKNEMVAYDDIVNLYETEAEAKENGHGEPEPQEVLEWWLCSDWLLEKLEAHGEPILKTDFGSWWGRTCSGQAIYQDGVIEKIYKEANKHL